LSESAAEPFSSERAISSEKGLNRDAQDGVADAAPYAVHVKPSAIQNTSHAVAPVSAYHGSVPYLESSVQEAREDGNAGSNSHHSPKDKKKKKKSKKKKKKEEEEDTAEVVATVPTSTTSLPDHLR
jgi:hypothetical protein